MKKIIILIFAFFAIQNISAQAQSLCVEWEKCFGGTKGDVAYSVRQTPDSGFVIVGSTMSVNGNVIGRQIMDTLHSDYWIVKTNGVGAVQWQKTYGGTGDDVAQSVALSSDGGFVVAGYSNSTNGNITGNHGGYDFWVLKLDSVGNIQWQKSYGGSAEDKAYDIKRTTDGGYIIAGSAQCSGCNQVVTSNGDIHIQSWCLNCDSTDVWAVKTDSAGVLQWEMLEGTANLDIANSVLQSPNGHYILTGRTNTVTNSNCNSTPCKYDYFTMDITNNGTYYNARSFGGTGNDSAFSICSSPSGNYVVVGKADSTNGNVSCGSNAWALELSSVLSGTNLTIQRNKCYGRGAIHTISPTVGGGYILAGDTVGGSWLIKLDSALNRQISRVIIGQNYTYSAQPTFDGGYVVVGYATDHNLSDFHGGVGGDFWIAKLNSCVCSPVYTTDSVYNCSGNVGDPSHYIGTSYDTLQSLTGCDSFVTHNRFLSSYSYSYLPPVSDCAHLIGNIGGILYNGHIYTYSGSYVVDSFPTANGCDSFIRVNITLLYSSSRSLTISACDNYTFNGATLTQSGTYYDTLVNAVGCDSFITLYLTIHHSDTTIISQNSCNAFVYRGTSYTQSGIYYVVLTNTEGCDSIIKLILSLNIPIITQVDSACDNYVFGNRTLTQSGTYYDTIHNSQGCSSIVELILSINNYSTSVQQTETACGSYIFGNRVLTQNGTYYETLQNAQGCDSVITLQLTINSLPHPTINGSGNYLQTQSFSSFQWLLNGAPINGATSQTYTAIENGYYSVIVTNISGCSDTSAVWYITTVSGIKDVSDETFSIVPNPSNGKFTITSTSATQGTIEVYSITGAKVFSQNVSSLAKTNLDISNQAKGVYVVKVSNAENVWTQRVIIE